MPKDRRSPKMTRFFLLGSLPLALLAGAGTLSAQAQSGAAVPWPKVESRVKADPKVEARITALLAKMSVEQKVGQVFQGDIA